MFFQKGDSLGKEKRDKYYSHLPVYTGGNVFFNGAQPCKKEKNYAVADLNSKVFVKLVDYYNHKRGINPIPGPFAEQRNNL